MNIRKNWLKWALPSAALVALAGCATPQYATQTTFRAPLSVQGQSCVANQCQKNLNQCQTTCTATRESCIAHIEPAVQQAYHEAQIGYDAAVRQYQTDRQFYDLNRAMRLSMLQPIFVPGRGWVYAPGYWGYGGGFGYPYDSPPEPPTPPSMSAIRQHLISERCDNAPCPCQQNYEQCYLGCGGGVQKSVVCIANCRDSDPKPAPQAPDLGTQQTLTPLPTN
jgi:hypothetical protein